MFLCVQRHLYWRRRIFFFFCHIHNHTEYNQKWNVFSAFNMHTHTWSSEQPALRRPGSSWRFGALLKGLTSVVDNSCRSRDSNPQPQVTSPTLYPLEPRLPCVQNSMPSFTKTACCLQNYRIIVSCLDKIDLNNVWKIWIFCYINRCLSFQ